jgi:hypothetical protein
MESQCGHWKTLGLFAGDLDDPIFVGGTPAYDAIFEKNILMLRGHLDHYLHWFSVPRNFLMDQDELSIFFIELNERFTPTPIRIDMRERVGDVRTF